MKRLLSDKLRILGIAPSTWGFGFAVLEGEEELIDWGVKAIRRREHKNEDCLRQLADLTDRYRPDVIVVENWQVRGSRRSPRIQELIQEILALASQRGIRSRRFSRTQIRKAFASSSVSTKYEMAVEIAKRFPELAPRLPRRRKPWMSEDERMGIFDAMALAFSYFHRKVG